MISTRSVGYPYSMSRVFVLSMLYAMSSGLEQLAVLGPFLETIGTPKSMDRVESELLLCGYPRELADIILLYLGRCFEVGDPCAFVCPGGGFWCSGKVLEVDYDEEVVRISVDGWESSTSGVVELYIHSQLVCTKEDMSKYDIASDIQTYNQKRLFLSAKQVPRRLGLGNKFRIRGLFYIICEKDDKKTLEIEAAFARGECILPENSSLDRKIYPKRWRTRTSTD